MLGPDGMPLMPELVYDTYGRIQNTQTDAAGIPGGYDDDDVEDMGEGQDSRGSSPSHSHPSSPSSSRPSSPSARKGGGIGRESNTTTSSGHNSPKKSKKKEAPLKKLGPKKIAAIERVMSEKREYVRAYKKAYHRPTIEEKVEKTIEDFHNNMLFGREPLGYEMSLEKCKELTVNSDLEEVQLRKHSNYFHKIVAEEKLAKEKSKFRKVKITANMRPKSANAAFNILMEQQYAEIDDILMTRNGGGERVGPSDPRMRYAVGGSVEGGDSLNIPDRTGATRDSANMGFVRTGQGGPQGGNYGPGGPHGRKCDGKKFEDGDAADKTMRSRGFGMLPTRHKEPVPYGVRQLKNGPPRSLFEAAEKQHDITINSVPLIQSFASDGSGRPASPDELQDRGRQKELREKIKRDIALGAGKTSTGSFSPTGTQDKYSSAIGGISANVKERQRPQTAKQFRRANFN